MGVAGVTEFHNYHPLGNDTKHSTLLRIVLRRLWQY